MNWEAVGAVGETAGALAVMLSQWSDFIAIDGVSKVWELR